MLRREYWLLCQYNTANNCKYYLGHLGVCDLDIKILYSEYKTAPIKTAIKIQYIYVKVDKGRHTKFTYVSRKWAMPDLQH